MGNNVVTNVGLFIASFQIGGDKPGAPSFRINMCVYTPGETISGIGHITQAVNPPLDIPTNLQGQFTYMSVMPNNCHILVTATGTPIVKWPQGGGIGPVLPINVDLRMVLTEDWKTGKANYKYQDSKGNWQEVTNAPVISIPNVSQN